MKFEWSVFFALSFFVGVTSAARAAQTLYTVDGFPDIVSQSSENGLKTLMWPDKSASQVSVDIWYRVGSLQETPGITGIAHLFEHMMLRPSKYAPEGSLAWERTMGADVGAETRFKSTNYHIVATPEKLEDVLRYFADIMTQHSVTAQMLENEKGAVGSEYLNWDNTPELIAIPLLSKIAFPNHPAQYFVTGVRDDLKKISVADCLKFYKSYYAPNNAVLSISGKFEPTAATELVQKYFSSIKKGTAVRLPDELKTLPSAKVVTVPVPGESNPLLVTYPIPFSTLPNNENIALDMAMYILFNGRSSLIGEQLISKQKIASSIGFDSGGSLGFYFVQLSLNKGEYQKALQIIDEGNKSLKQLSESRYKAFAFAAQTDNLRSLQNPKQRAHMLGFYEVYRGGVNALKLDLSLAKNVRLKDVKAAAEKYLNPNNRLAVFGTPKGQ